MASATPLSTKDTHILSLLSLPHSPLPHAAPPTCTLDHTSTPNSTPSPVAQTEASVLSPLNHPSPSPTTLTTAISHLTTLISTHPTHAPTYNNRAQALRLLLGSDLFSPPVHNSSIWSDLSTAIALSAASATELQGESQRRTTLASAHTQRAWLVYKAAARHKCVEGAGGGEVLPAEVRGLDREGMEEWARREFEEGGRCGNEVAREMARGLNPVRKLCGKIVGEMMRGEMGGMEGWGGGGGGGEEDDDGDLQEGLKGG